MPKPSLRDSLPHVCLGITLLLPLGGFAVPAAAAPTNLIVRTVPVKTPGHPDSYEIYLYSSATFPMNDTSPTLSVGSKTFLISRYVANRPLDEIVFSLTPSQFQALHYGDPVAVYYNPDDAGNPAEEYTFGPLKTPLLPTPKTSTAN